MLDFYQKRKFRKVINSKLMQGLLFVVATFVVWNAFERYTVADEMEGRLESLTQTAAALQARKDALESEVHYLQDDRGIEAEMRRQFDVALPGEEVVVIIDKDPLPEVLPLATTTQETWWPFW